VQFDNGVNRGHVALLQPAMKKKKKKRKKEKKKITQENGRICGRTKAVVDVHESIVLLGYKWLRQNHPIQRQQRKKTAEREHADE
jgi:hypothetical protein